MWRAGQSRRVFQQNRRGCQAPEGNTLPTSFSKGHPAGPHVDGFCVFGRAGAKRSTHSDWLSGDTAFRCGLAALNHRPAPLCPPGTISSGLPRTQRSGCLCPLSRLNKPSLSPIGESPPRLFHFRCVSPAGRGSKNFNEENEPWRVVERDAASFSSPPPDAGRGRSLHCVLCRRRTGRGTDY
jgi:hypothetical protein